MIASGAKSNSALGRRVRHSSDSLSSSLSTLPSRKLPLFMLRRQLARTNLTLVPKRSLTRPAIAPLPRRAPLSRLSPCSRVAIPLVLSRSYAQGPPGGGMGGGGFPGFNMMGQQRQKGDALKEYVSTHIFALFHSCILLPGLETCATCLTLESNCNLVAKQRTQDLPAASA